MVENRLTFLEDSKDMHEFFEWLEYYEGEYPGFEELPSRLFSVKVNNLGELLYLTLYPKMGLVYRHNENTDPLQIGMKILGYTPIVGFEGVSNHRYYSGILNKEARNKNPHRIIPYYNENALDLKYANNSYPRNELLKLGFN